MENKNTQTKSKKHYGPFLAFEEVFFKKHQKTLLFFLNTPIIKTFFRYILAIKEVDVPLGKKIESIGPNRFTVDAGLQYFKKSELLKTDYQNPEVSRYYRRIAKKLYLKIKAGKVEDKLILLPAKKTDFRTHVKYSKRLYYAFKPMWWAMHYWDELIADQHAPALSFGFLTLTQYPGSAGANNPVDGYASNNNIGTWAGCHDALAGTSVDDTSDELQPLCDKTSNYCLQRCFMLFDTSALTAGATITGAPISLYVISGATEGNRNCDIVSSNPASNTALANADFDQVGATSFCNATPSTGAGYSAFTLDANGIANVSKTGTSKFGIIHHKDFANTAPTDRNYLGFNASEHTGTTQDPKIVVTYTTNTNWTKDLTETVTLVETQAHQTAKPFTEVITLVETMAVKLSGKTLSEVITLVETQLHRAGKAILETITLNEIFSRLSNTFRTLTETVTLVDSVATIKIATLAFAETITLVETMTEKITAKVLLEVVTLVDTVTTLATMFRSLTEVITLVDTVGVIRQWARALTETITLVEANIVRTTSKVFAEVVTMAETFTKMFTHPITLTEVVTLVDTKALVHIFNRAFTEVITLVDTVTHAALKVLHFIEHLSLTQRFLGLLNGKDIRYIQKYTSKAGTYIKKYLSIPDEDN